MYCFRFCIIFVTEFIVTIMILKRISILNYKNLEQVELSFSPKLNCFFGQNGMGKTNLLDAVYFCLSVKVPVIPLIPRISAMMPTSLLFKGFMRLPMGLLRKSTVV